MNDKLERIVQITGAFDRRNPDPKKNYGIHGMEIRFVLKGEKGATQFVVYTPIHLPHVADELFANQKGKYNPFKCMGVDIGYHSHEPLYEDQSLMQSDCPYTNGPCYYDGSSLAAEEFMPQFLSGGSDAAWKMLEEKYNEWFLTTNHGH